MAKKWKLKQTEVAGPVEVGSVSARREVAWWVQGLIVFGVTYCLGLGLRLWELPFWLAGDFRIDGQWLMATNDAYLFLAGAEGVPFARSGGRPPAIFVEFWSRLSGLPPATIAFYAPAVVAPLAALPICLVAARWRLPEAGLWAGLMTVLAPGYWQRTRLGFLDDDFLFMPAALLLVGGLVLLLAPYCRAGLWGRESVEQSDGQMVGWSDVAYLLAGGLVLGLWAKLCVAIYPKGDVLVYATTLVALLVGTILAKPAARLYIAAAFVLLFTAWFATPLIILATMLTIVGAIFLKRYANFRGWLPEFPSNAVWFSTLIFAFVLAVLFTHHFWLERLTWTSNKIQQYYQAVHTKNTSIELILGNISEAIQLPAWAVSYLLAGHWSLVILGTVGFGLLLWKRPLAALYVPLAGIAGAAYFLGARFTLFSAPFFGLGLGCGLVLLLRHYAIETKWRWFLLVVLAPLVFWFVLKPITHFRPDIVLSVKQAEALQEVGNISPKSAFLWNYWDLGYASNYYSGRRAVEKSPRSGFYANALTEDDKGSMRNQIVNHSKKREHYIVVSWEKLGGIGNMLAHATFNPATGQSAKTGNIQKMTGSFEFDLNKGFLVSPGGRIPLRTLDVIEENGPQRYAWPWHDKGNHVVLNRMERSGYLMDPTVSETMYVQLLLGRAEEMEPEFELVVDDWPWVRVYRVKR